MKTKLEDRKMIEYEVSQGEAITRLYYPNGRLYKIEYCTDVEALRVAYHPVVLRRKTPGGLTGN